MTLNPKLHGRIRDYLLGLLTGAELEEFERTLLVDDDLFEELQIMEDELIDEYVSGELSADERLLFEKNFLADPESHLKLKLGRALDHRFAGAAQAPVLAAAAPRVTPQRERRSWSFNWFSSPLRVAVAALLIVGVAFVVWRVFFHQSDVDRGLTALNAAYRDQRPIMSRISGFGYAQFSQTRGVEQDRFDATERDRAERILLDAVHDRPAAQSYHALGVLYLAEKQFDKAIEQFDLALKSAPNDAQLRSDLGAAYLEKARILRSRNEGGKSLETLSLSLEQLTRAIELNPALLEGRFNRALCLQAMSLPQQARAAWQEYLKADSTSQWAEEARSNLKLLGEQQGSAKSPPEVLADFLAAFRHQDDERAWQILRQTQEMITSMMVPLQLTNGIVNAQGKGDSGAAAELINALDYAGSLEMRRAGDPYFAELANYYKTSAALHTNQLDNARQERLAGYQSCLQSNYDNAVTHFKQAQQLFENAGDNCESRMIDYWLAYCYSRMDRLEESRNLANKLAELSDQHRYHWLRVQALALVGGNDSALREYSLAVTAVRTALNLAKQIGDTYMQQKLLGQLTALYNQLGELDQAIECVDAAVNSSDSYFSSPRQKWRNYSEATEILTEAKLGISAVAFGREEVYLAQSLNDLAIVHDAYLDLARLNGGISSHQEAVTYARMSQEIACSLPGDRASVAMSAYSNLALAHLLRQAGDCSEALSWYKNATAFYAPNRETSSSLAFYESRKGQLLCQVTMKDDAAVGQELPEVLAMFDRHREAIIDEQNRNSFFDKEQTVYDVAIDFAHSHQDDEAAFNYSEASRARSLLDLFTNSKPPGPPTAGETAQRVAKPLTLSEIQARMPEQIQVLQYSVLPLRTLVWVITREGFAVREIPVSIEDLRSQALEFTQLVSKDSGSLPELRRRAERLYKILIEPVQSLLQTDRTVCIVPDKELNLLPFAALVSPATGKYFLVDHALLFAPSSTLAVLLAEAARAKEGQRSENLVSIGNPRFDHTTYSDLPDLPAAAQEAMAVSQLYSGSTPVLAEQANRQSFLDGMKNADVIHYAGHYLVDRKVPDRSRLLLAKNGNNDDGSLTVLNVFAGKRVRPRLVVLSACQTGLDRFYRGEGGIGIARAFLGVGVPIVVASLWPVDSDASSQLMIAFHRYRKQNRMTSIAALRQAQLDLASQSDRFQQPYYWAAFAPFGGYASF